MNKKLEVLKCEERRKITLLSNIMRNSKYELLHLIIQRKIVGGKGQLEEDLFRAVRIAIMLANLR